MDAFSYLSVLLSIIIGLAMTQILMGYRALLLTKGAVRSDSIALLWSGLLLLFATQAWWASFGLAQQKEWSFIGFAVVLLQMILLYMMTAVILPDIPTTEDVDLTAHFAEHRRLFFSFLIGVLAVSVFKDYLLNGELPTPANLIFHAMLAVTAMIGIIVSNRKVQLALAVFALVGFVSYVGLLFARL
jgi:hypothetical protein